MRTFTASGFATMLAAGGSYYTLITIHANSEDDWGTSIDKTALGTLASYSLGADTTVLTGKLKSCDNIDISGDPADDTLAKTAEYAFVIKNIAGAVDPLDYLGRIVTVRIGVGAQMTYASSEIFFTGNIAATESERFETRFICRGRLEQQNKQVGKPIPDTAHEKYRGKCYPMAWGDWTDETAYLPLVMFYDKSMRITADTENWKNLEALYLFDDVRIEGYKLIETSQYQVDSDENQIYFDAQVTTLAENIGATTTRFKLTDSTIIQYFTSIGGTQVPAQTLLRIDDEIMLVMRNPAISANNYVEVERGFDNTTPATHTTTTAVHQITEGIAGYRVRVSHRFFPRAYSGFYKLNHSGTPWWGTTFLASGSVDDILNYTEFATYREHRGRLDHNFNPGDYSYIFYDMIFDKIGVTGTILDQNLLAKTYVSNQIVSGAISTFTTRLDICKDSAYFKATATATRSTVGTTTDSFDNIDAMADGEEDINMYGLSIGITNIEDLPTTRYSAVFHLDLTEDPGTGDTAEFILRLYAMGMLINFEVDPTQYDVFARAECRKHPGSYYNGTSGDLIENPSIVLEDFCRNDVPSVTASDLSETHFNDYYAEREDWKFAMVIQHDMDEL